MRAMQTALMLLAALAAAGAARADETVAAAAAAEAAPAAEVEEEFVIPDGFRVKKRGEFTVYCRKETVMGTRLPAEKCYDQAGIRAMLAAQRDDQERLDQLRRICSSQAHCGAN